MKMPPVVKKIGVSDVLIFTGLGSCFYGLWQLRPWIAFVSVGLYLLALGTIASLRGNG